MTHCALLSGKWDNIIANDVTDSVKVFFAAINGEFDGYALCPSREEWFRYKDSDTAMALMMSFGNDRTTYAWSPEVEAVKVPATKMLTSPSLWERYQWFHRFCDALASFLEEGGDVQRRLQGIEGTERLVQLERARRLQGLQGLQCDYRLVDIPEGAVVYCDPPYRSTANSSRYGAFDFDAFDMWLGGVDFPVFVSEFDAPAGCVEVASTERVTSMSATSTDTRVERMFVQERFADQVQVGEPALF